MAEEPLEDVIRNIESRVRRIEQILPTLATREELQAAIAPLATREDIAALATREDIAPLATREEIASLATREEIALLATREEMYAAIATEGERARRHATALFEDLRDDNRIVLEHLVALSARVDDLTRR